MKRSTSRLTRDVSRLVSGDVLRDTGETPSNRTSSALSTAVNRVDTGLAQNGGRAGPLRALGLGQPGATTMKAYTLTFTALITLTSSFALGLAQAPDQPRFDCGSLKPAQAQTIENETSSDGLKELAKTCEEQATTFQKIAVEAQSSLPQKDVTALYEKAATAHLYVASFTNEAFLK